MRWGWFRRSRRSAPPLPPAPKAVDVIAPLLRQLGEVDTLLGDLKTVISHEKGHPVANKP